MRVQPLVSFKGIDSFTLPLVGLLLCSALAQRPTNSANSEAAKNRLTKSYINRYVSEWIGTHVGNTVRDRVM